MEKNSRTEMLPGKRDFYRCCKAKRSASHVNKEFWQQFQNYAPPTLRVIRTKFARTIYNILYIYDSHLRVSRSLRSLANDAYVARVELAYLDHNHHLGRAQLHTKDGNPVYTRKWSKRSSRWNLVSIPVPKTYSYVPGM